MCVSREHRWSLARETLPFSETRVYSRSVFFLAVRRRLHRRPFCAGLAVLLKSFDKHCKALFTCESIIMF